MYHEHERRLADDPSPTEEELAIGSYLEALEPQVRGAVREMRRKGYATHSSGFYGYDHAAQVMEGAFALAEKTTAHLAQIGLEVEQRRAMTLMRFYPQAPDLPTIRERWDLIAGLLPDLGRPARPGRDYGSNRFRRLHREGRLRTDFVRHWLDDMGTYDGAAGLLSGHRRASIQR